MMNALVLFGLCSTLVSGLQDARSDPGPEELSAQLRSLADEFHEQGLFEGAVLVARDGEVLLRAAYGLANAEHGVANTPETRFRLASVTKAWTATAILLLSETGRLSLDDPVGVHVHALQSSAGSLGDVTLHQLLSHSAGIVRDVDGLTSKNMGDEFSMPEMIELIAGSTLQNRPGETWAYSNAGYVLLAATIESVTGLRYGEAMQTLIFEPLGIVDTGHEVTGPLFMHRASGHLALPDGLVNAPFENKSYVTGAGSLYSTVDDLWKWSRTLLGEELLSSESLEAVFSVQAGRYGYGWFVGDGFGPLAEVRSERGRVVHHDGGCPGFATQVLHYLDHRITVIALANVRPSNPDLLAGALADLLLGLPVQVPRATRTDEICRLAVKEGVEAARERWDALSEAGGAGGQLSTAADLNNCGYRYLSARLPRKAQKVFELNVAAHPDYANGWDSLAECCLLLGERKRAIEYYSRAFEMDSTNTNAKRVLAKLEATASSER